MIVAAFTKSSKIGSKLIRWGLSERVSHFEIELDDRIVFHSHFTGTGIAWLAERRDVRESVLEIQFNMTPECEEVVYEELIKLREMSYDYGAFCYFTWRVLLWKILGRQMPTSNRWASDKAYLCTEVSGALRAASKRIKVLYGLDVLTPFQSLPTDLSMISAYKLWTLLEGHITKEDKDDP